MTKPADLKTDIPRLNSPTRSAFVVTVQHCAPTSSVLIVSLFLPKAQVPLHVFLAALFPSSKNGTTKKEYNFGAQ